MKPETAYNPDVLLCLANLSNDEVFTPPAIAESMLDLLPVGLWSDPNAKFLDPVSKSGVFLREIAKRLMVGLEGQMPDVQDRINHIYTQQIYGIAITELTGLLSRRSLYCSKYANGKYSIVTSFDSEIGNIKFERTEHNWMNGKCVFCGASKLEYDRSDELETHAYEFIHTNKPEEIHSMKFDVIIGNPPYQLSTGGSGVQATPLYNKFILQAKKLNPRFLTMIVPARWYSGGFGLDSFRDEMLNDNRIRKIVDYPEATDAFSGVQIKGGVMYFLWDRDNPGDVEVSTFRQNSVVSNAIRPLLERGSETFIRYNEAINILHKIWRFNEPTFEKLVSQQKPFGFATTFKGRDKKVADNEVVVYGSKGTGYVSPMEVRSSKNLIDSYKVLIPRAGSGSDKFPHSILGKPFVPPLRSACTETYVAIGPFSSKDEADNVVGYISTQFFRFLVMLMKPTQDALRRVYSFVPQQDFTHGWDDEKLYRKYGISKDEIVFIESMIRPMELDV